MPVHTSVIVLSLTLPSMLGTNELHCFDSASKAAEHVDPMSRAVTAETLRTAKSRMQSEDPICLRANGTFSFAICITLIEMVSVYRILNAGRF
jgi:hypothetical protein